MDLKRTVAWVLLAALVILCFAATAFAKEESADARSSGLSIADVERLYPYLTWRNVTVSASSIEGKTWGDLALSMYDGVYVFLPADSSGMLATQEEADSMRPQNGQRFAIARRSNGEMTALATLVVTGASLPTATPSPAATASPTAIPTPPQTSSPRPSPTATAAPSSSPSPSVTRTPEPSAEIPPVLPQEPALWDFETLESLPGDTASCAEDSGMFFGQHETWNGTVYYTLRGLTLSSSRLPAAQVVNALETPPSVQVRLEEADGRAVAMDGRVTTGMILRALEDDKTVAAAYVVVKGDARCSGILNLSQIVAVADMVKGNEGYEPLAYDAADLNDDQRVTVSDLARIAKMYSSAAA